MTCAHGEHMFAIRSTKSHIIRLTETGEYGERGTGDGTQNRELLDPRGGLSGVGSHRVFLRWSFRHLIFKSVTSLFHNVRIVRHSWRFL